MKLLLQIIFNPCLLIEMQSERGGFFAVVVALHDLAGLQLLYIKYMILHTLEYNSCGYLGKHNYRDNFVNISEVFLWP